MSRYLSRLAARSGIPTIPASVSSPGLDGAPVTSSINTTNDIEVHDETVVASPAASSLSTNTASTTLPGASKPNAEPAQVNRVSSIPDSTRPESRAVMGRGIVGKLKTGLDDLSVESGHKVSPAKQEPDPQSPRQVEHPGQPAGQATIEINADTQTGSDSKRNSSRHSGTADNATGFHFEQSVRTAPGTANERFELAAMGARQIESVSSRDGTEHQQAITALQAPVEKHFNQPALKTTDKQALSGNTSVPSDTKPSTPNVQVRIGNIQLEVHQPVTPHADPIRQQPAMSTNPPASSERPVRFSRHYLRGW